MPHLLAQKSHFLLGPRSTGKSFLIRQQLGDKAFVVDLLRGDLFLKLSANPSDLEGVIQAVGPENRIVVIDEIQKIPMLLDEVHRLLEKRGWIFLLTGSSARKLKRGHANLLAGRAWMAHLFPLVSHEIPNFDLDRFLRYGGLPQVTPSSHPAEELDAYVQTYIREEIRTEGLVRHLPPFSRFLKSSALSNGMLLNFAQLSSDTEIPASTIREYYSILEDTLIGFFLEPWTGSKKRKAIQTAKFYFFDTGVTHTLTGTQSLDRNSNLYGASFEQFLGLELRAYLDYKRLKFPLTFWRSVHGQEVDFLIGDQVAVEVKATSRISRRGLGGLLALSEEKKFKKYYLVTQDPIASKNGEILCLPWKDFLEKLWNNEVI